jgi:hypothetical protein
MALILGAFYFSSYTFASSWKSAEWLKLGRYHQSIFGYKSEADGPGYFLHSNGRTRPDLEFEALVNGIQSPKVEDPNQHPICRFPARTHYLLKIFPHLKKTEVVCENFEAFRARLSARSVSLVFSSYYLNNPASSFGHTFIRLGKNEYKKLNDETRTELLDTGINYGASTGDAGALTYVLGAFVGYFYGTYNSIPYYYKVREYNDFESRDLWTYHLDFNQQEIDQLVRHIWELGHGDFRYYFLTENCSYHALTMLETIRPGLELVKHLPRAYIIPSDTLKVAVSQKIVKEITYRPSASTQFYRHLKELDENEKMAMKEIAQGKNPRLNLPLEKQALVYDSALSLVDYKFAKEILKEEKDAHALKRPILLKRSEIPLRSSDLNYDTFSQSKPHEGHNSGRLLLGTTFLEDSSFLNVDYRFAFHDFLDYQKSYMPNSRVEMLSMRTISDGKQISLTDVNLADYYSLGAFDEFTKSYSWKLKFGQWQTFRKGDEGLTTHGAVAGYGHSFTTRFVTPFILASFESSYVSEELHKMKFAWGADIGFLTHFSDNLRHSTFYELRFHPWEESTLKNEIRWSNVSYGIGLFHHTQTKLGFSEFGLNMMVYTQ